MGIVDDDEFLACEFDRLLKENTHLRQVALGLTVDMHQLELLLDAPEDVEPMEDFKVCVLPFPEKADAVQYSDYLMHLSDENALLRSKIHLAEVEIFQMELTLENRAHLVASDELLEDLPPLTTEEPTPHIMVEDCPSLYKKILDAQSSYTPSEPSECEFPKIKAVFESDKRTKESKAGNKYITRRNRQMSCSSTTSWTSCHTRITTASSTTSQLTNKSRTPKKPRAKKGTTGFMGCRRSVNVDASSSAFFASLRS